MWQQNCFAISQDPASSHAGPRAQGTLPPRVRRGACSGHELVPPRQCKGVAGGDAFREGVLCCQEGDCGHSVHTCFLGQLFFTANSFIGILVPKTVYFPSSFLVYPLFLPSGSGRGYLGGQRCDFGGWVEWFPSPNLWK